MKRVPVFSDAALRDLDEIFEFLGEQFGDLQRARAFVSSVVAQIEKIATLPAVLGRPRESLAPGLRSFPFRGYLIFMHYREDSLFIVNILHARRDIETYYLEDDDQSP